jgi:hypothetical protein
MAVIRGSAVLALTAVARIARWIENVSAELDVCREGV